MTRQLPRRKETTLMTTPTPHEQTKSKAAKTAKKARVAKQRAHPAPSKVKPARKATGAKTAAPTRRVSKTAKILDLLRRSGGVTLKEIMNVTQWQAHSVRGFLSGTVGKKMRTQVESFKTSDGERSYRLSSK